MDKLFPECNHLLIEAGYAYDGVSDTGSPVKIHKYHKGNLHIGILLFGENIRDLDLTCFIDETMIATTFKDSDQSMSIFSNVPFLELFEVILHHTAKDIISVLTEKETNKTLEVLDGNDNT